MIAGVVRLSSHGIEGVVRSPFGLMMLGVCTQLSLVTSWEPKEFARR
jgi:hypothetical protein